MVHLPMRWYTLCCLGFVATALFVGRSTLQNTGDWSFRSRTCIRRSRISNSESLQEMVTWHVCTLIPQSVENEIREQWEASEVLQVRYGAWAYTVSKLPKLAWRKLLCHSRM